MASPECIAELCQFIEGVYGPGKFPPVTEQSLVAWHMVLEPVADEDLAEAVMAHCREESWPPAPADLVRRSGTRTYRDRAHRPFELEAHPAGQRGAHIDHLMREAREHLAPVVDLDERRSS